MISKRIGIAPKNDNYARLANYIAVAGGEGEKLFTSWCAGCSENEYAEAITEVLETQARNYRVKTAKTYHLIVSFRPEDEARLTPEAFREIEERFAAALGYSEHQRHCAVHKNTGNLHMHVAYNAIHPERLIRHEPFRDYHKRDRLCRELEREYGLTVDRGREQGPERPSLGGKAALAEAHSGKESFESYAKRHTPHILEALEQAANWQGFHESLARYGLEIKPHGNGLVIKDRHGKHAVKASAVDRSLSMKKLEARFGAYCPPQGLEHVQEFSRYQTVPLHRAPERGNLFAEYRQAIDKRKIQLEAVKEREDAALAAIRKKWADKRKEIERMGIAKKNRRNLLALARKHEAEAIARAKLAMQPEREAVRRDIPFTGWNGFLQHKAEQGNETALAVLRSRREAVAEEKEAVPTKDWSQHGKDQFQRKAEYAGKERAALELDGVSGKAKKRLLAVLRMESLVSEKGLDSFQHKVDGKGAVVFTLPGGGKIRDTGGEVLFSPDSERIALSYAQKKWGRGIILAGNQITRDQKSERELEKGKEQRRGMER